MQRLSTTEHDRLTCAIAEVEERTQVHLALVVVPASDRHLMYPLAYGALLALAAGGVLALCWPQMTLRLAFIAQAVVFAGCSLLFDWLPLRLLLVPRSIMRTRARSLAHREFAARILATHRGGLLLFVSLGERYVELLADRDLHARVVSKTWEEIVAKLTTDLKTKPLSDSLLAAIARCEAAIQVSPPAVS